MLFNRKDANLFTLSTIYLLIIVSLYSCTTSKSPFDPTATSSANASGDGSSTNVQTNYLPGFIIVSNIITNISTTITPEGIVTTIAGSGASSSGDGTGSSASFTSPTGIAIDASSGSIYIEDQYAVRKMTKNGVVTTWVGGGTLGYVDGTGTIARFSALDGIGVNSSGEVFLSDINNPRIRKATSSAVVSTFIGTGSSGSVDGTGTAASLSGARGICVDSSGNIFFADSAVAKIRKITPTGIVTTFAGGGSGDGTGIAAGFSYPYGICIDSSDNLYVVDQSTYKIRKITSGAVVTTLAGRGSLGYVDGVGTSAAFHNSTGIAVDKNGNVYVSDYGNARIRKITSAGVVSTLAGNGSTGSTDGNGVGATVYPMGMTYDSIDNCLYITDPGVLKIKKITLLTTNTVTNVTVTTSLTRVQ